jgi:Ca-activated chloride channel family protein
MSDKSYSSSEQYDNYAQSESYAAGAEVASRSDNTSSSSNIAPPMDGSQGEALLDQDESQIEQETTIEVNPEEDASLDNQLTFAVDVDTASYTLARQSLRDGYLPSPARVRVEEFINFFDYQDEAPENLEESPFAVHLDAAQAPFAENKTLLRIGLKGYEVPDSERPATNLVFLVDTSGSMGSSIELVRQSLGLLLDNLNETDTIAIVTYAGSSEVALRPTSVSSREDILSAMGSLSAGGSTNGASGIITAYDLAESAFKQGGLNRVVLCTDGDFNVGVRGQELYDLIEEKREGGITLSVLGFGRHNNDEQMEQLADRGNGNYTFIDSLREAQRALVDRLTATLMVIAKDVKV